MNQKVIDPEKPVSPGSSMLNKPLPMILDEMDGAIAAAAESARRAETALVQARQAAKDAGEAAAKAANAAVEGARIELLGKIAELDKAIKHDRGANAAVFKALQEENKQLRQENAETESRLNGRIDRLVMVVGAAGQAMNDIYCQPKSGLKSV